MESKRIKFIRSRYEIVKEFDLDGFDTSFYDILDFDDEIIVRVNNIVKGGKTKIKVIYSESIFNKMLTVDPTKNKENAQWMLQLTTKLLKNGKNEDVKRFLTEDLELSGKYLKLFSENKNKKRFKEFALTNESLSDIENPSDIYKYGSLSQLFDAVDPFMERDVSSIERTINRMVKSKKGLITLNNRKHMIFVPLCVEACIIFSDYVSWCTSSRGNGMFKRYTKKDKEPCGSDSKLHIIINKEFFEGVLNDDTLYQVHVESGQFHNRRQVGNEFYKNVIKKSKDVDKYFHDVILENAKKSLKSDSIYFKTLIKFGHSQTLFEILDDITPVIEVNQLMLPVLVDLKRFVNLESLIITKSKVRDLNNGVNNPNLKELILVDNEIVDFDIDFTNLKKLLFINLKGNKIKRINNDIRMLDSSNGGSLYRLVLNRNVKQQLRDDLEKLLPNVKIEYDGN